MRKRSIVVLAVVWIVVLVAGISSAVTMSLYGAFDPINTTGSGGRVEVTLEQYQRIERYERLDEVRKELSDHYYTELDEDALILGAVRGMAAAADDPYTAYYTPEEMHKSAVLSQGLYEGVGLLLSGDKAGELTVLRVFDKSPAHEAGVMAGDRIIRIGNVAVNAKTQKSRDEAIDMLRHEDDKLVTVTIRRGDEILTIGMARSTIQIQRVDYELLPENIGYIALYEFNGNDVEGFKAAVKAFKAAQVKKVIIDVRSNPGGRLSDVVDICDQLMPEGLIVYTQDRDGRRQNYFSDSSYWDVEIAVLVNNMSASASEILAGALKDTSRALIVGEQTFGKGIVQTLVPLKPDGAGIQLTTATYVTPGGKSIHGVGIEPDIVVSLGEADSVVLRTGASLDHDQQLKTAYEALLKKR